MSHFYEYCHPATIPTSPAPQNSALYMVDDFIRCSRCRFGGCDVKVNACGCSFHARCFPVQKENAPLKACPSCGTVATSGFSLYPMNFAEVDEARRSEAISKDKEKQGRKRKNSVISQDDSVDSKQSKSKAGKIRKHSASEPKDGKDGLELRTGRWTLEEMSFCDKLIMCFKDGLLPLAQGTKLNDFLASVLRSKQSRLTKKMKNAKLSSNTYKKKISFIDNDYLCFEFSSLEDNFFLAIADARERAELKFHMRKLWREMFSNHCLSIGQPLDVDAWLSSVEEMDRRKAIVRDASRMQRRKLMMGYALCQDSQFAEAGVFIERSEDELVNAHNNEPLKPFGSSNVAFHPTETEEMLALLNDDFPEKIDSNLFSVPEESAINFESVGKSSILHSSPFLSKVINYIKRHNVPFEHVDVWVPNYQGDNNSKCILGFAGSATSDQEIPASGRAPAQKMDADSKFNLLAFGDYSQKFSFSVGCGLPGRVFESCTATWEAGNHTHFERSGGASQWGIKTVVAIPIPSPNVGRIVAVLYSRHERQHNQTLVSKLQDEFSKLMPTPKWKLVIDMGSPSAAVKTGPGTVKPLISNSLNMAPMAPTLTQAHVPAPAVSPNPDPRISQIVNILADELSSSVMNHQDSLTNDMISLRLMLLKPNRSTSENELMTTILGSYSSYNSSLRPRKEIAIMVARDYSFMTQNQQGIPEVSLHHTDYTISSLPPPSQGQCDQYPALGPIQCQSNPTLTEFSPLDPKVPFYSIEGADLGAFRSNSPALTPIEPLMEKTVDSLSVISN